MGLVARISWMMARHDETTGRHWNTQGFDGVQVCRATPFLGTKGATISPTVVGPFLDQEALRVAVVYPEIP